MNRVKSASIFVIALLLLVSPSISSQLFQSRATQLIFFGTSEAIVTSDTSVLLTMNLTNVETQSVSATAQAVIENAINNETLAVENSSVFTLSPSLPTIINMTLDLSLCTNYSIAVEIFSTGGAVLAPIRQMYSFPCESYSQALTLSSPITVVDLGPYQALNATFSNTLDINLTAVVFAVLHNQIGQTVYVGTDTLTLEPGQAANAYVIATIPKGTYNGTIFVLNVNGTSVSSPYSAQLTFS